MSKSRLARIKPWRYLTLPETAEYLDISEEAVLKAIRKGRLEARQVDRDWFIRKDWARDFKKRRT